MDERLSTQSYSLEDHICAEKSNSCSDYVMYKKLFRICKNYLEDKDSVDEIIETFKLGTIEVFKVKKSIIIEKCNRLLDRSNSNDLRYLLTQSEQLSVIDFVKFVTEYKLRTHPKVLKK